MPLIDHHLTGLKPSPRVFSIAASLLVVLLICGPHAWCQKAVVIGKVVNAQDTYEPVLFASIGLHKSPVGTISNGKGEFRLVVENPSPNDSIVITHLSFKTKKIPLQNISNHEVQIQMEPAEIVLNEIIVTAVPITQILEKAIRISKEKIKVPVSLATYYREFVKRDNIYDKFADGQLDYLLEGKPGKIKTLVKVNESRAGAMIHDSEEEFDLELTSALDVQDALTHLEVDRIGKFLSPENYSDYDYQMRVIKNSSDEALERIEIRPKPEIHKMLFEAEVDIEPKSSLIRSVNYRVADTHKEYAEERNALIIRLRVLDANIRMDYKVFDDRYYLFYSSRKVSMRVWNQKRIDNTFEFLSDIVVTNILPSEQFDKKGTYKKKSLYKNGTDFTNKYWENTNAIRLTDDEERIIESFQN